MSDVIKETGNRGIRNSLEEKQVFSHEKLRCNYWTFVLFYTQSVHKVATKHIIWT